MPSAFVKPIIALAALAVMLLSAPAFAQGKSSSGDPFASESAVDSEQMSAVSGGQMGMIGAGPASQTGAGGLTGNDIGTTSHDMSVSGNTVRISVKAINNQTSRAAGSINTSGGLNTSIGGGGSASGGS